MSINNYRLREIKAEDLEQVLVWRNSDRIRTCMFSDHLISREEHLLWYKRIQKSSSTKCIILEYLSSPIGLINIKGIDMLSKYCFWGFYLGDTSAPPKSGLALGYLGLDYIFGELCMRKLCSQVLISNEISLRYHEKLGFVREGYLRQQVYRNNNIFEDVVVYGLLKDEWEDRKLLLLNKLKE